MSTDLNRRTFFKLVAAAVAVANTPDVIVKAAELVAVEDPLGGWIPCDGRSLSRLEFPELFATVGTTYGGSGDSFCIPLYWREGLYHLPGIMIKARNDDSDHIPVGMMRVPALMVGAKS